MAVLLKYSDIDKFIADVQPFFEDQDITIKCTDGDVTANSLILKARSKVFKTMLENESSIEYQTKTIILPNIPKESMTIFMKYITTGVVQGQIMLPTVGCDLLYLANKYDLQLLKSDMEAILLNNINGEGGSRIYEVLNLISPQLLKDAGAKKPCVRDGKNGGDID